MTEEEGHMMHALELAQRGSYLVSPNPLVGCVVVKNGKVIGRGWHKKPGKEHAEINALSDVKKKFGTQASEILKGSELYVNLEPCSLTGRTPPCCKSIIKSGIKKVFIASKDPMQKGLEELASNNITINLGLLQDKAEELNKGFFSRLNKGRPMISCKLAISMDGGIGLKNGESKWISSLESRGDVHDIRARSDAILTGSGTILKDNPRLTVRLLNKSSSSYSQPLRCVVDSSLKITGNENIFSDNLKTIIFCNSAKKEINTPSNIEIIEKPDKGDSVSLMEVCKYLGKSEINYLLVESGPRLVGGLLKEKLIDEFILFIAPKLMGKEKLNFAKIERGMNNINLKIQSIDEIGGDIKLLARPQYN